MIVVYSRKSCAPCQTLKLFLTKRKLDFVELDVDNSTHLNRLIETTGKTTVPTTIVNGNTVIGLNIGMINKLITDSL